MRAASSKHRVWRLGADIDTDALAPGHAMKFGIERIAEHCLEGPRPELARGARPGDVIVAGPNFGIGSSREQAAAVLVQLGIAAVIAPSFSGLYFRNAFNLGLLLLTCPQCERVGEGERIAIDLDAPAIVTADGTRLACEPLPAFLLDMVRAGGLMNQLRQRLGHKKAPMPDSTPLDPVTLAVLRGRLEQVADEMDATLYRSAFNPIIAEAHDACHGLYDAASGDTLIQGKSGLPVFVGAMAFAVRAAVAAAQPRGGMKDGEIWISNDAYDGGTHANDFKLVRPFYRAGKLFCYMASAAHWHDVGGAVPGNYNPAATECWQEAVQIPPVRIVRGGELDRDVLAILQANTRLPDSLWGDLNGQLAALELGARRLAGVLDEYGDALVLRAMGELRSRALRLMRSHIDSLPDGRYSFEDLLDNDGITPEPLTIALDMTVAGERLTLDFSRSSPQCAGPVNISRATAVAACYVALKHLFPDVPANAGVLDAVEVVIPDRLVISAERPRPVGGYTETILRMIDVIFSAAAQADATRAVAHAYGTINALSIAGQRSDAGREGQRWVMFSFFGGGHGGHSGGDGLSHGNAPISTATIPPLEILEAAYPVRFTEWALRPDSGGDGRYRGGLGAIYEIELLEQQAEVFVFGERGISPPKGIAGGGPGALNVFRYEQNGAWQLPPMVSKMRGITLKRGERVRLETPGGGGWGDARERSARQREADLALGYVGGKREGEGA